MSRPPALTALGVATLGLAAATLPLHPRAAMPAILLCLLLHAARCTRVAIVLLAVLMIGTLAGIRIDAAPPATPRLER